MARIPARFHKIDGWRGYWIPGRAVAGASDTGMWPDSPAPTDAVKAEIRRFQRECLRPAGIKSRTSMGRSSNVCCGKRWALVDAKDFARAQAMAEVWLDTHKASTYYIHHAR